MNIYNDSLVNENDHTGDLAFWTRGPFGNLLAQLAGSRPSYAADQISAVDPDSDVSMSELSEPSEEMESSMKPKIIFIHGMFLNPKSWEHWIQYFETLGYSCEAPAWPLHNGEPADLRAQLPPGLGCLSLSEVYTHFQKVIQLETEPPICIGHSMGGLVVQKLVSDGLIRAGIGICSVAPNRMLAADWGFLRNSSSITNPFAGDEPYPMTREGFHQNFANTLSEDESNVAYAKYAMDESRQVLRDVLDYEGKIDMDLPHVPLLLIGAEKDNIIPSSLVRRNAHAYADKRSHSEFAEFTGRGHFICGEPGWEEVADKISNWLDAHLHAERA